MTQNQVQRANARETITSLWRVDMVFNAGVTRMRVRQRQRTGHLLNEGGFFGCSVSQVTSISGQKWQWPPRQSAAAAHIEQFTALPAYAAAATQSPKRLSRQVVGEHICGLRTPSGCTPCSIGPADPGRPATGAVGPSSAKSPSARTPACNGSRKGARSCRRPILRCVHGQTLSSTLFRWISNSEMAAGVTPKCSWPAPAFRAGVVTISGAPQTTARQSACNPGRLAAAGFIIGRPLHFFALAVDVPRVFGGNFHLLHDRVVQVVERSRETSVLAYLPPSRLISAA